MGCKQSKPAATRTAAVKSTSTKGAQGPAMSNEVFKVPTGCEVGTVKSVLSGDRLQLEDGRIISLLGVNAPKAGSKEQYATESRALLASMCEPGKKVFLESDAVEAGVDGAVPRYLYVKDSTTTSADSAKMANFEALRSGYAQFNNHDGEKLSQSPALLRAVREARLSKTGCWSTFDSSATVHAVKQGTVYHRENCEKIVTEMHLLEYVTGDAIDEGLTACPICKA